MALAGSIELRQERLVPITAIAERGDLLGQVLHPRPARRTLGGVALIQASEIVVQLRVGLADELGQGRAREVTILVVDRLDPVPSTAISSRPNRSS